MKRMDDQGAVDFLSADFAAASKNSGKNLCCLLKIDITSVIDATENEHTSRRYTVVFFVLVTKFMMQASRINDLHRQPYGPFTYYITQQSYIFGPPTPYAM